MQTLGLADSTPRSESRLKSLFWPSIQSGADVDYLGAQGYWLCSVFAAFSLITGAAMNHPVAGFLGCGLYYLSGVGIRERSRYAAAIASLFSLGDLATSPGILKILFTALLLSNLRATWIASRWKPESEESALPPRLSTTLADKFADRLPSLLWPKLRVVYYIFSAGVTVLFFAGMAALIHYGLWTVLPR